MISMTLGDVAVIAGGTLVGEERRFGSVTTDSRNVQAGELFVALEGQSFDGHDYVVEAIERGACGALVSRAPTRGVLPLVIVEDTRRALGRLSAAWRAHFKGPLIALTGSNGKTTVKEMLASILGCRGPVLATRGNLNNDIGVPLTLLRLQPEHADAVIEMGANHAGEIAYLSRLAVPDVAIINNVGPAHLEGFGTLDGVARAKGEILQGLGPAGIAVINRDDPYADFWCALAGERRVTGFSLGGAADVRGQMLASDAGFTRFRLESQGGEIDIRLPLLGAHNVRNALAAAGASLAVGAGLEDIRRGLESMDGVAGRLQRLSGRHGVTVINDAYNANPASLAAALAAVQESATSKWLVLGDMGELGGGAAQLHEQAGHQARSMGFARLYGLGDQSRRAVQAFGTGARHFKTAEELIQELLEAVARIEEKPLILVKGSRSMRMETIVQSLVGDPSQSAMGGA